MVIQLTEETAQEFNDTKAKLDLINNHIALLKKLVRQAEEMKKAMLFEIIAKKL